MIQNMLARIPQPQQVQTNLGNLGLLASATQPSNSSGAMGGIMDSVQTGFDQLDSAMQGAFDTIKQSLSSSYTPQEVLVPNEGGGGQQPSFPGGGGGFYGGQSGSDDNSGAGGGSSYYGGNANYTVTDASTEIGGYGSGQSYSTGGLPCLDMCKV